MKVKSESEVAQSCPTLSDPMDCSYQAPLSMRFSKQEYWSGVPLPSLSNLITRTLLEMGIPGPHPRPADSETEGWAPVCVFWQDFWVVLRHLKSEKCCPRASVAPHSSTLAWEIPWTEEPGGLQSMGSLRVGQDWATSLSLFPFMHRRRKWQPTPVFLPGESQGQEPGGLPSVGSHRVGHDWSDLAAAAAAAEHPWGSYLERFCDFLCWHTHSDSVLGTDSAIPLPGSSWAGLSLFPRPLHTSVPSGHSFHNYQGETHCGI